MVSLVSCLLILQKKADYIKRVTQILADKFNGDIPSTMEELVSVCVCVHKIM